VRPLRARSPAPPGCHQVPGVPAPVLLVGRPVGVLHRRLSPVRPEAAGPSGRAPVEVVMPVGAPPPQTKLDQLRPQLLAMLDNPLRLCTEGGGRVLARQCPDGTLKPVDKLGGYSIRPLAYWAEKGEYPSTPIPKCPHDPFCVDCGRFVLDGGAPPDAAPIAPVGQVPPPPPVPAAPPSPVVSVERSGAGVEDAPLGASLALVPVSVPAVVPRRRRVPVGAVRRLRPVGVLLLAGLAMAALWSGVSSAVVPLEDTMPSGDVVVVSVATIPGQ
jgi:hypothetical protein